MNTSLEHYPKFGVPEGLQAGSTPLTPSSVPTSSADFHFQTQTPRPHPMATMSKAVPVETKSAPVAKVKAEVKAEVAAANAARDKNLELAVSSITKSFGEGSIM